MGWHNLKTHFRIEHIVQVREGKILIGSGYVAALLIVTLDAQHRGQRRPARGPFSVALGWAS